MPGSGGCRDEGRAMHDYDVFSVESKAEVLAKSREFWNPGKTDFWSDRALIWSSTGARATSSGTCPASD